MERIINKIINENIDIDKLLVVTFTNAAASEMRERVLDAIYKKLDEDPYNENLQKQINLLNMASICTIDSFCLDVVKNNFYQLENISPNFRIADTPEIELLKQEVLDELFEEKYLSNDEDFIKLINTYTGYRDDTPLKDLILNIYSYISSSPYPNKWLDEKIDIFNLKEEINKDFSNTTWGKILLDEMNDELIDDIVILTDVLKSLKSDEKLEIFAQIIESDIKQLSTLQNNLENWDASYEIAQNLKLKTWSRKKIESELKQEAKDIRDSVKDKFYNKLKKIFVSNSEQSIQDIIDMYKILKKLEKLIFEFDEIFSKRKRDKNIVDFSDIEHFALEILVKEVEVTIDDDGKIKEKIIKSEIAKRYTEKFEEIAIDEYQDSNLVQEYILSSISRGNNMFMVGDVKQSIYRFRQAMPKLFLDKYEQFETVGTEQKRFTNLSKDVENSNELRGRKIQLFKNFRSRNNVLEFTNLIFKNIMSHELGEVEYDENEYLNFGAEDYQKTNQNLKTEIDIIDVIKDNEINKNNEQENKYDETNDEDEDKEQEEYIENIELEARYIAQKIKELVDNKYQIYDRKNECFRDIKYKDIAILLRSTKDKANIYEQEIMKQKMPVFSDSNQEYLESIEIQTIMNLLKVIDNPMQDIPLVAVLRSNIAGFSDDELVEIRLSDKYDNFYNCLLKAKVDVSQEIKDKIEKFLQKIKCWRKEQEYLALDELIWKIYSDTGYYNYVGLMPNGNLRQANLKMLFERAKKYETASFKGLYNFINFIERLKSTSGDLGAAKIIGENDDVIRIMSIHKSKGLEFPIVFLANSNKQFNEQDIRKNPILLHQEMGIGAKYIDYNAQVQYDTLTREAVKEIIRNENISEEMRILYVGLTRAKEKLFIVGTSNNYTTQIEKIEKQVSMYNRENGKINHILVKKYKSYLDWILLVYMYEKENSKLFELNIIDSKKIVNKNINDNKNDTSNEIIQLLNSKKKYTDLQQEIKEKIEYKYQNILSTTIPTKTSVTKIKQMQHETLGIDIEEIQNEDNKKEIKFNVPKFLQNEEELKITPAQKGTLMHLCMQNLNPKEDYDLQKIKDLIKKLESKQIITSKESQAININKILQFTKSKIWNELKEAQEIYQEKPFYINIPAKQIYEENIEENMLVQGIIDLYYINKKGEIILLDYKTDYVEDGKESELIEKYKTQLDLYKEALEQALNKNVSKVYIYSIYLGKEIEI